MQQIGFFIAKLIVCSTCFGHHYAHHQELRELYRWLLPVVLGFLVYRSLVWCGAVGYVSGLRDTARLASQAVSRKWGHLIVVQEITMFIGTILRTEVSGCRGVLSYVQANLLEQISKKDHVTYFCHTKS
jgi:hypothetical protein